jgi:dTDP-4-dehydrorhamnose reductase
MIWLIGNKGMLGCEVEECLRAQGLPCIGTDKEVDITDKAALRDFAHDKALEWVINCAAYTAVDKAEDEIQLAFQINAEGTRSVAEVARKLGTRLIHISTDYVFGGGSGRGELCEADPLAPLCIYGKSKALGEQYLEDIWEKHFILRTAWLYGARGPNFVTTMLRLFGERGEVRVVSDQWGSPTYARDLARTIVQIVGMDATRYGTYHVTNEGRTNWYEFAVVIYALARRKGLVTNDVRIVPISTEEYPTRAVRPRNSYMSKEKLARELGITMRPWQDALDDFLTSGVTSLSPEQGGSIVPFKPMPQQAKEDQKG